MQFWRTSEGGVRWWLAAFGLVQVLFMAFDLYQYGPKNPRWMQSLSLAVASLATVPLEEYWRKRVPWHQQLRTPYGLVAGLAFITFLGLSLWILIDYQKEVKSKSILFPASAPAPATVSKAVSVGCGIEGKSWIVPAPRAKMLDVDRNATNAELA